MEITEEKVTITTTNECVEIVVDLDGSRTGGYDYETIDSNLPYRYTCMICTMIQREPTLTSCCGQHFCQSCLLTCFLVSGGRCPHCQATAVQHFVNKQQQREIKCLRVKCRNSVTGCTWTGALGEVETHEQECCGRWYLYYFSVCTHYKFIWTPSLP